MQRGSIQVDQPECIDNGPGEEPMLELNTLFSRIKDMQERVGVLRGYL